MVFFSFTGFSKIVVKSRLFCQKQPKALDRVIRYATISGIVVHGTKREEGRPRELQR